MKVAYLNAYGNGSTGSIVNNLKIECKKRGIDTLSIYSRENSNKIENSIKIFDKKRFLFDVLMTRIFDSHGLNSAWNTRKILSVLEKFNPDIIHIHNLHGYWINYKKLFNYIKKKNIKVVWTFHDCWSFTGHCTHFDFSRCEKWKKQCYNCSQKGEYPKASLRDNSTVNYESKKKSFCGVKKMIIVTPSEWLKKQVKNSFFSDYEIRVINNGIDLNKFRKINSEKRGEILGNGFEAIILGVASFWNERKGLNYILEVANNRPEWMFVVIGKVLNNYQESLKYKNIIWIDRTEDVDELAEWYSSADVYVNTTLEDTYPTTNLESIACHTPVVTFPTGGSVEIVEKTGCGMVTCERTASELENSIKMVLCKNMNFDAVEVYLDSSIRFKEYIDLYEELCK